MKNSNKNIEKEIKITEKAFKTETSKTSRRSIILILFSSVCAGTGQLFLKYALNLPFILNFYLLEWAFLYLIAIVLMTLSFREGELSILFPFLATSYVWVILISPIFIVTETITSFKVLGSILVFLGVSLMGIGARN